MCRRPAPARRLVAAAAASGLLALTACGGTDGDTAGTPGPTEEPTTASPTSPSGTGDGGQSEEETPKEPRTPPDPEVVDTVATDLEVPWGIAFLPDGTALVSERDRARIVAVEDGSVRPVGRLESVRPQGEAGLLGLAVSPTFEDDSYVYAYFTTDQDNRVVRMEYDGRRLGSPEVVLDGIPSGFIHDGGRLEFGPDGNLYVSTGEIGQEQLAQDRGSLAGKILRITPDGDPAPGNPDESSPVWTWGHRNVQGLAFDDQDRLWATEFGASDWDELNRIEKGENYGWPRVEGRGGQNRFRDPVTQWRVAEASPSGLAYHEGSLWAASLRGQRLWRIPVNDDGSIEEPEAFFVGDHGRLRTVVAAPDGRLWLSTSNRDGRGDPAGKDDRILVLELG